MGNRTKNSDESNHETVIEFGTNNQSENDILREEDNDFSETLEPTPEQKNKVKGRRGRPKGSTNKKTTIFLETEAAVDTDELTDDVLKSATKSVKNSEAYKKRKSGKFYTEKQAQETTDLILNTINGIAIGFIGEEASMNGIEASLLNISLPQYLQTLEISTVEKTSAILYPMIGLVGISLYGLRLSSIIMEKRKQENTIHEQQQQEYVATSQGGIETPIDNAASMQGDKVDWSKTKQKLTTSLNI